LIAGDLAYGIVLDNVVKFSRWTRAISTIFGWCLGGPDVIEDDTKPKKSICNSIVVEREQSVMNRLDTLYSLESSEKLELNEIVSEEFEQYLTFKNRKASTTLPWAADPSNLSNGLALAYKRLQSTIKKWSTMNMLTAYEEALMEYVQLGYAEPLPAPNTSGYFLPHSGVLREKSLTTKLRIVFDGSAKTTDSYSLNDLLLRGPDLNPTIFQQLIVWRSAEVVAVADIEKAFLQITIAKEDRKYLQFMWLKNNKLHIYQMKVLPFGLICSPAILATAIRLHLSTSSHPVQCLSNRFYVDDLVIPAESINQLVKLKQAVCDSLDEIGMSLRKWHCSDHKLEHDWNEDGEQKVSVLGIEWNLPEGQLEVKINQYVRPNKVTRAEVLSYLASVFDPLGIMAPAWLQLKSFCQSLAKKKIDWKSELPTELVDQFEMIVKQFEENKVIAVDRHPWSSTNWYLAVFCDASLDGYGACAYLVCPGQESRLLCAKGRVAPIEDLSIPKLELMSAVLAAKLVKEIRQILVEIPVRCFSDSSCNIDRMKGKPTDMPIFERNRIRTILSITAISDWHHVKGKENPADILSRGCTMSELETNQLWLNGPNWLVGMCIPTYIRPEIPAEWSEPPK
jgi:hypothetical protein